ncbi:Cupredoxin [Pseudoneurospora amorphoporcata]|uniref:Cupredoxin n=1 Tax=Pseudoneurospora amorphoporcata TaxID=241081 RepID=A0AAN6NZF6_9PEZI|nr:Cupredoxin [Pseudoneurospora amorphoporcata]
MKVTTAVLAALSLAPVALGKVAHNVYPDVRRGDVTLGVRGDKGNDNQNANANDNKDNKNNRKNSKKATEQEIADLAKLIGLTAGLNAQLNLLWVNLGGGSVTTVINSAKTVTVTATQAVTVVNGAASGEATAPPAADVPPAAPATPTEPAGVAAPVGGAATHTVTVGGPQGLAFSPAQTQAAVGDTVIFTFLSQNHTVTQSAFDTPCVALPGGMDSGFQANVNNTVNPPPQVAMQVMVDTPLWFYCKQGNHCGKGMVFSINPTAEKTHAQFQAQAIAQNGTGTDSGITGGTASAAPPAAPSATVGGGGATAVAGGAAQATGNIVTGVGQVNADGSCVCAVSCAAGSFPNIAAQGVNAFGGVGGSIPRAMALGAPAPAPA